MTRLRLLAALFIALATLLTACGSDSSDDSGGAPASGTKADAKADAKTEPKTEATAPAASGGGDVDGPCDVTDQATVASVFAGAGAGTPGQVRNCEYKLASGPVQVVNVFLYEDTTLAEFKKQDTQNGITFTPVQVGDGAIRDQLSTVTVQQGDTLFSVQALPRSGKQTDYAKNDPQVLALATKIAGNL